jgi:hypothetical protein
VIQDFTEGDIFSYLDWDWNRPVQNCIVYEKAKGFIKDARKAPDIMKFAQWLKLEYLKSSYNTMDDKVSIDAAELEAASIEKISNDPEIKAAAAAAITAEEAMKTNKDMNAAIAANTTHMDMVAAKQAEAATEIAALRKASALYKQFLIQNSLLKLHGSDKSKFPNTIKAYSKFCIALGVANVYATGAFTNAANVVASLGMGLLASVTRK